MLDEETRKERIRESKRRYNEQNRDKIKAAANAKRRENREATLKREREWRAKNKDKIAATMKRYAERHPEKVAARKKKWNDANAKRRADWQRDYVAKNRDRVAKMKRDYLDAHPDKILAYNHRRRARLKGATTPEEMYLAEIRVKQVKSSSDVAPCAYCENYFTMENLHIDHVVPLARGGKHAPGNLLLACRECNSSKGTKILLSEWTPPFMRNKNAAPDRSDAAGGKVSS